MARIARISRLLPKTFADGTKIRRFAKHCPRCRHFVEATEMEGLLGMMENRLHLSARARCPRCSTRFAVDCVISQEKRVHPVKLPHTLFHLWLRFALRNAVTIEEPDAEWQYSQAIQPPTIATPAETELAFSDSIVGRFQGMEIPATCEYRSQPYRFDRVVPAGVPAKGNDEEILVRSHLVYRLASAEI